MAAFLTNLLIFTIATLLILVFGIYFFFKRAYGFWERQNISYIPGEFVYGSIKNMFLMKSTLGEEMAKWYNEFKAKGKKYGGGYLGYQPFLLITDINLIGNVLSKDFSHFADKGIFVDKDNDPLSAHLFSLNGKEWKPLRRKLSPTFSPVKLKLMFQTLVDCTNELEDCLEKFKEINEPIDIKKIYLQYTINVIGSCAFGINCDSFAEPNSEFVQIGDKVFSPKLLPRCKFMFCHIFPKIANFFKLMATSKDVDKFIRELVQSTIEYREKNNITRNDLMHLLIQLKNKGEVDGVSHNNNFDEESIAKPKNVGTTLTINEIAANVFLFYIAGFETTASTMTFCLYELSKRQDIQDKTRQEIVNVLNKYDGKITYEAVQKMQYLDQVVSETLRKWPPLDFIRRVVSKDYQIPNSKVILKKGTVIFISATGVHRDPEFYPNPEVFDPDRFTKENKSKRPDFVYFPFGEGPRICIGYRFGLLQAKLGVCKLLKNYKFTLNPKTRDPLKLDPTNFVASALGGIWLDAMKV